MWMIADILSGREFAATWIPVVNGLTRMATYAFAAYMTAKVRALLVSVTELATRDALTGLLNRHAFDEVGEAEARRARRYGHDLAIIDLDLDNFKELNDTRDHANGDRALRAVSVALRSALRATDRVARLGGDEFAILIAIGLASQKPRVY